MPPWEKYAAPAGDGPWARYPKGEEAARPAVDRDTGTQRVDAATVYVDEMLFGLPGKASAALNAAVRAPFTDKSFGEEYDTIRRQYQNARAQYADDHPIANTVASIGGAIHGGGAANAIAGRAITQAAPRAAQAFQSTYAGRMAGDAASGVAQGAASAYGHDENVGAGAAIGGVVGGLARPVLSAGGAVLDSAGGLIGVGNAGRANRAVAEAAARSGQTREDVRDALFRAAQDGQAEFTVADALGNSGQRMLTGIVRSPGDMRQTITETLQRRQAGQGRRLQNTLVEGFDAPRTAQQTKDALDEARGRMADRSYEMARYGLTPEDFENAVIPQGGMRAYLETLPKPRVDVRGVISAIDDRIGGMEGSGVTGDSIDSALRSFRDRLTTPTDKLPDGVHSIDLSDFDRVLGVKKDLRDAIEVARRAGQNNRVRELNKVHSVLDQALEESSPAYRMANDQFASTSRVIDAVDQGTAAAMRGRVEDTIPEFQGMTPQQQAAYRVGYADPYIADLQKTAGPATNRARPLITEATAAEFPAFAAPGRGQQMQDRIAREQRMFETYNAALGGSKTADNAADQLDVQSFDPTMLGMVMSGNFPGAALRGLQNGINTIQGRNSQTRDLAARILLGTNGDGIVAFNQALDAAKTNEGLRERILRALISGAATSPQSLAN